MRPCTSRGGHDDLVFILYAVLAGLILGRLVGGHAGRLGAIRFQWSGLVAVGMVTQVALFSDPVAARIVELLRARNVQIPILMGGVIPPEDRQRLRALGVGAIYGQEATLAEVVEGVKNLTQESRE